MQDNLGIDVSRPSTSASARPVTTLAKNRLSLENFKSLKITDLSSTLPQPDSVGTPNSALSQAADNYAKLALILQSKDEANRGLITFDQLMDSLKMLEDVNISEKEANQLISMSNSRSGNHVRYRSLLDLLRNKRTRLEKTVTSNMASDITEEYTRPSLLLLSRII